jgi:hypothetical protein
MTPKIRKLVLTAHIALSVGWVGAITGFLVLSVASLTSQKAEIVRGAYVSMNLIGLYAIVPLGFAALLTGLVQSLGTSWGLFRQYWTVTKFGLTVGAVFLLLVHQFEAIGRLSQLVLSLPPGVLPTFGSLETELLVKAGIAIVVLLVTTVLSVYKPWGFTPYGRRIRQQERIAQLAPTGAHNGLGLSDSEEVAAHGFPLGLEVSLAVIALLIGVLAVLHHLGGHGAGHRHF